MTNADKYKMSDEDADKMSDEFAEWHQDNPDVRGYGEALFRFLQAEVKPTLTEDEKVILRNIDKSFRYVGRSGNADYNYMYISHNANQSDYDTFAFDSLFLFIEPGDEYKIEELLED